MECWYIAWGKGEDVYIKFYLKHTLFHYVQSQMSIELKEGSHIKDAQKKGKEDCES